MARRAKTYPVVTGEKLGKTIEEDFLPGQEMEQMEKESNEAFGSTGNKDADDALSAIDEMFGTPVAPHEQQLMAELEAAEDDFAEALKMPAVMVEIQEKAEAEKKPLAFKGPLVTEVYQVNHDGPDPIFKERKVTPITAKESERKGAKTMAEQNDTPQELLIQVMERNHSFFRDALVSVQCAIDKTEEKIAKLSETLIKLKERRDEIEDVAGCNNMIHLKVKQLTFNFMKSA